jgi:hypothetical protein
MAAASVAAAAASVEAGEVSVEVAVASMAAVMEVAGTVKKKHLIKPPQSKKWESSGECVRGRLAREAAFFDVEEREEKHVLA